MSTLSSTAAMVAKVYVPIVRSVSGGWSGCPGSPLTRYDHFMPRVIPAGRAVTRACRGNRPATWGSEQAEPCGLRDGRGARAAPQLPADVRDVSMNRVRADHELYRDLLLREAARHQFEHLTLALRQHLVRAFRLAPHPLTEALATGAHHRVGILVPGEMRASRERNEHGLRQRCGELTAERVRHGAVTSPVHDDRRGSSDARQVA